ncbi:acidic leucine-rich nuclear phosphoprotein 32 family member E isoform X1 [Diorhabda carinulata]|uniref:acidic leucine-rich nuclear phosphoprotein 32 family member E isoform X1 n=1 Tax=Diorhabda carinulata TaxID=1163345 RepID=UPI0025A1F3FE|nr:acidic leucine-rich nuclear phosphoprotein 32 family member E isoform X1 [Diorhabda carinulata]XP_057668985.1 acidic leucine-rich nuclear phosphoprotein 32 family member E isoform X1 [Diorhabda carinulata]XP_057668986.1 acidic leucine-rich nuclear phosphoprotein 32 family member E isoform X1 [Diorhabda carinulata]
MMTEDNGNIMAGQLKPTSSSNEDLSEYTDADESISAPTEILAEFLSAVMLKDYETALKYCKLILQYEPNNSTAKEFYPLIIEKLQMMNKEDIDSNNDSEEEGGSEDSSSSSDSENTTSEDSSDGQEEEEEEEEEEGIESGQAGEDKRSKGSSEGDGTTGSYSSLEDDEADPVDQLAALAARYQIDNVNLGNGNKIYNTNLSTTLGFQNKMALFNSKMKMSAANANTTQENQLPFGTSSDSESPTEPVTQQTVALLRARVVPSNI